MESDKINDLTPNKKRIYRYLIIKKGMSIAQISKDLNIPKSTVYSSIKQLCKMDLVVKSDFLSFPTYRAREFPN